MKLLKSLTCIILAPAMLTLSASGSAVLLDIESPSVRSNRVGTDVFPITSSEVAMSVLAKMTEIITDKTNKSKIASLFDCIIRGDEVSIFYELYSINFDSENENVRNILRTNSIDLATFVQQNLTDTSQRTWYSSPLGMVPTIIEGETIWPISAAQQALFSFARQVSYITYYSTEDNTGRVFIQTMSPYLLQAYTPDMAYNILANARWENPLNNRAAAEAANALDRELTKILKDTAEENDVEVDICEADCLLEGMTLSSRAAAASGEA